MTWIDDELNAERRSAGAESAKNERELHRAKLTEAKGRELWDMLRNECRERVLEYERKCGNDLRCKVRFDDSDPDSLYIQMEHIVERTRALVRLELTHYQVRVQHITWSGDSTPPRKDDSYFAFECDGLEVSLSSAGSRISVPDAAKCILRPVLFSSF
jgi:hypothetical protein